MRVVHIQYSASSGGSAAFRLHQAFLKAQIDSSIVSLQNDGPSDPGILYMNRSARLKARLDNQLQALLLRRANPQFGYFSYPLLGTNIARLAAVKAADAIYIHWALNGFLNFRSIKQLAALQKPVFIVMHDMWPLTGGCHHSFTCEKYKTRCASCQILPAGSNIDLAAKGFARKKKLYATLQNLYFISPSNWLYRCAQQAALTREKAVFHIPNLLDPQLYKPVERQFARKVLNVESSGFVVAFGAHALQNPYKGWTYLQQALEQLQHDNQFAGLTVLVFGSGYKKELASAIPFKTIFLGSLKDAYSTVLAYNAADVFVAPSLADNLPTTVMESLSCGTPVAGFRVGGIPDMVRHKENGYLARYKDAGDLAEGIKYCLLRPLKGYSLPAFAPSTILQQHLDLLNKTCLHKTEWPTTPPLSPNLLYSSKKR